jgi:hypothetical protein
MSFRLRAPRFGGQVGVASLAGSCGASLMGREMASGEQRRRTPVGAALPVNDESFELERRQQSGSFVPGYVEQARGLLDGQTHSRKQQEFGSQSDQITPLGCHRYCYCQCVFADVGTPCASGSPAN